MLQRRLIEKYNHGAGNLQCRSDQKEGKLKPVRVMGTRVHNYIKLCISVGPFQLKEMTDNLVLCICSAIN